MASLHSSLQTVIPIRRLAVAVLGALMLTGPLLPAQAQTSSTAAPTAAPTAKQRQAAAAQHEETVEQRIRTLHAELKITPAEESDWQAVAQTMRDNAAAITKLADEKASQSQQGMTAVDDLQTYMQFAQAHVDGLKNLMASFQTLYNAMPDPQKKLADQVFLNSMRRPNARAG